MNLERFFSDHWKEIESERLARYEEMFQWRDGQKALLAPAALEPGHRVLDVGAGPGFFALGIAGLVGEAGAVDGVDINARFVEGANARAADRANVNFHLLEDHRLPFADATFDRAICKNVLEYVPDVHETLTEIRRVLKPGGRVLIIDSDWGFVIVEPWGKDIVDRFFEAAAPAFQERYIGRRAAGALARCGLTDITVSMMPIVDREGSGMSVLINMASYIRTFGTMPEAELSELMAQAEQGVRDGTYLFCLPQFLVTGTVP